MSVEGGGDEDDEEDDGVRRGRLADGSSVLVLGIEVDVEGDVEDGRFRDEDAMADSMFSSPFDGSVVCESSSRWWLCPWL